MSVIIKTMERPKCCVSCPLFVLNEHGHRICYASPETHIDYWEAEFNRHSKCPMEEEE